MSTQDIINYYSNLLPVQYATKPKASATIQALVTPLIMNELPVAVLNGFNILTAVGPQLDVIGQYVGLSRNVAITIQRNYFNLDSYATPGTESFTLYGLTTYTNTATNAGSCSYFYVFYDTTTYALSDGEYQQLLQLQIVLNTSNNTSQSIMTLLTQFFGTTVLLYDNLDMTISYTILPSVTHIATLARQLAMLPKPAGVMLANIFSLSNPSMMWGLVSYSNNYANANCGISRYSTGGNGYYMISYSNNLLTVGY